MYFTSNPNRIKSYQACFRCYKAGFTLNRSCTVNAGGYSTIQGKSLVTCGFDCLVMLSVLQREPDHVPLDSQNMFYPNIRMISGLVYDAV